MTKKLNFTVLTIFPEMFPGPVGQSITGNALEEGLWSMYVVNIRDFAIDQHSTVDDRPFGGGSGMVMKPDVLSNAIESLEKIDRLIYMSPRGKPLNQELVEEISSSGNVGIICGRYEGIDERVINEFDIEELSVGDYVLSGGEIGAFSLIDACVRQISGVLGNPEAVLEESFGSGGYKNLLEYPHYTRPADWKGKKVPEVLLSGNHEDIQSWRFNKALEITKERRKDLWRKYELQKGAKEK